MQHWVLDSYGQLKVLRARLHDALTGEALPDGRKLDEVPEKMAVVATELATNALKHARPPTVVELRRTDTTFIIDIADNEVSSLPELAPDRAPGAGGLGLLLTQRLALAMGWYVEDDVKHVWAQFRLPAA